jgi:hypothetical protein
MWKPAMATPGVLGMKRLGNVTKIETRSPPPPTWFETLKVARIEKDCAMLVRTGRQKVAVPPRSAPVSTAEVLVGCPPTAAALGSRLFSSQVSMRSAIMGKAAVPSACEPER